MKDIIKNKYNDLVSICKDLKIKRMYIFGSVSTETFNEDNDIDFLISFQDSISIKDYTDNFFTLHYKLKELFHRKIDVITERSLSNKYFVDSVNQTKELIYEA